jgi:hypothetical protein
MVESIPEKEKKKKRADIALKMYQMLKKGEYHFG